MSSNPYASPSAGGASPERARPGFSLRGLLAGVGTLILTMFVLAMVFTVVVVLWVGPDAMPTLGDSPFEVARDIPHVLWFSLGFWVMGCFCGGYVSARFSSDRQIVQALAVGAVAFTFVTLARAIPGNGLSLEDLQVLLLPAAAALGGYSRRRSERSARVGGHVQ